MVTVDWTLKLFFLHLCFVTSVFLEVTGLTVDKNGNFRGVDRVERATKNCDGFRCVTSEKCIKTEERCNGKVDCEDGSDEFNDCKKDVQCPGFLFTCDYGACIEENKVCDGKKDCRDNSDEAECVTGIADKISSNCKSNEFKCLSGQCISMDDKCNGIADCTDKSDETKATCLNKYCPGFTFVCDYGACVDGDAQCNGVKNCIDNSDEEGCNKTTVRPVGKPKPPTVVVPDGTSGCILPDYPDNGKWMVQGGAQASPGSNVGVNTLLIFSCNSQHKLSSENTLLACLDNGWTAEPPTCLTLCPTLHNTEVTQVTCFDENKAVIKCDSATDGSSAKFECATYYEPADRTLSTRFCDSGIWNLPPPQCIPVCGEKRVSAEALIVNGKNVLKGNYPWVTAIYIRQDDGTYLNVCGGSMLTQKLILTAAHCVTDDSANLVSKESIKIGVGKYYNQYKHPNDTQAQYSDVARIILHKNYKGENQRFASDIAFLVTKDVLLLSKVVQPVCYHDLPHIHLTVPKTGVITGWGFTVSSGTPSTELKELSIPYKDDATCFSELPKEWTDIYFTYDKFCAGHYNKSVAVCKGDSGGGLVFPNPKDGRFYIHGIVSLGLKNEKGCDIQRSSLYTKVAVHYDWLEELASRYR